jgi:hypothetical protein
VSGSIIALLALPATIWLTVATDPCDTTKHLCDIAPVAGIGFWVVLVGPVALVTTGIGVYRWLGRSGDAPDAGRAG